MIGVARRWSVGDIMADGDVIEITGVNTSGIYQGFNNLTVRIQADSAIQTDRNYSNSIRLTGLNPYIEISGTVQASIDSFTNYPIWPHDPLAVYPGAILVGGQGRVWIKSTGVVRVVDTTINGNTITTTGVTLRESGGLTNDGLLAGADIGAVGTASGSAINNGEIHAVIGVIRFASLANTGKIIATTIPTEQGSVAGGSSQVGAVNNSGEIRATASGTSSDALGVQLSSSVVNSGTITAIGSGDVTGVAYVEYRFTNSGVVTADARGGGADSGSAVGFNDDGDADLVNTGSINALSSHSAIGIRAYNGGALKNDVNGVIYADGLRAAAIDGGQGGIIRTFFVENRGLIEAKTTGAAPSYAIFVISDSGRQGLTLVNYGTIRADIVLQTDSRIVFSGGAHAPDGNDTVTNSGAIFGDLFFNFGVDKLTNSAAGTIQGLIDLGAENDVVVNDGLMTGTLALGDGADTLTGAGLVTGGVYGGAGDDKISSGAGNDFLSGGAGNDVIDGGGGGDTASYANDIAGAFVQLAWGWARDGWGSEDRVSNIENITGSAFNDVLISNTGDSRVQGGAGSDWIEDVGGGNDVLTGEAGNDVVFGADGADALTGGDGDDALLGGLGNDNLDGGDGIDWIYGGLGVDTVQGGAGKDILFGAEGGGATSTGDLGDNISGGDGDDALIGEEGDDALDGGAGHDWAYGGEGNDTIIGGDGNDVLAGENGNDAITGGLGDDFIFGGNGFDTLDGGAGNDWIEGSFGGARITGGAGADNLFGGDAATFVYTATSDSTEAAADVIGIFWRPGGDKIDVSAIDADGNAANGNGAFSFVSAFTNVAGQAVLSYDGTNSIARFDTNGDGVSDMSIVVLATQLQAGDFVA